MTRGGKLNREILLKILDLARWAPSGDNTQPWKFKILSDEEVLVIGSDTQSWCLYDFNGWPSQMAHGALLETMRIAATGFGVRATWKFHGMSEEGEYLYRVLFERSDSSPMDPLFPFIEQRTVQRRPMSMKPLSPAMRASLIDTVGNEFELKFLSSFSERMAVAKLLWSSARIRLTSPEAYRVHREIIEWGAKYSKDKIPEKAVGVDWMTARLMQWVLQDWHRVEFFNRYLFGTVLPRVQLDFLPAVCCASHVFLLPKARLAGVGNYVKTGVAMQRLWLTATSLGLHLQPQMTPLIFRWYARTGKSLSSIRAVLNHNSESLAVSIELLAGVEPHLPIGFFCRLGESKTPSSRSLRLGLKDLLR